MKIWKLLGVFVLVSLAVFAQSTAQMQGVVQDASGAAVPDAEVKATQTDTAAVRTATTAADGSYVLPNLPVGPYRLEVTKTGFTAYVQTGIVLQVNTTPTVDIALKVGNVSEQVQVEANAALVETQTTSVGAVIENQRILELPLNGRQAADLITIAGAAIPTGVAGAGGFPGTGQLVIAGGQAFGVGYYLDGGLFNNPWDNAYLPFPFPDALQEFKVESSAQLAGTGMHAGGTITAVTKSGTNQWHGDAFWFLRNGAVNGHNFFQTIPDNLKRHQYGGTIGGPAIKDKLFLFGGYQGTNTSQFVPANTAAFVPTAQMLLGDFRGCPATAATGVISPTRFSPASLNLVKVLPKSNDTACGRIDYGAINKVKEYQVVGRADYNISARQMFFTRYVATTYNRLPPFEYTPENALTTSLGGAFDNATQSANVGHTFLVSPTTVNQFRAVFNRVAIGRYQKDFVSACDLGVQMYCGYVPHQAVFNITGGFQLNAGTYGKGNGYSSTYEIDDSMSLVRGAHTIAFGGTISQYTMAGFFNVFAQGSFTFASLPAFLQGQVQSATVSSPNNIIEKKRYFGAFVQDTWKMSSRLTMNIGLRYEPWLPPRLTNNAIYNFSLTDFYAGKKTQQYVNAPPGLSFPGDPGFPGQSGVNSKWALLAPRLGFAWDPTGKGNTSVRVSYGIGYDFMNGQLFVNSANAPPFGNTQAFGTGTAAWDNLYASNPGGNIYPYAIGRNAPFAPFGAYIAMKPNNNTTTTHQWNFGLQRQFGGDWLVSATYMGSQTSHLWISRQLNPAPCLTGATCNTGNINTRRILQNPLIGFMDEYNDGGTSNYHGLLLAVQKRLSKGISISSNYTWSHCIGDLALGNSTGGSGSGIVDANNRDLDRGNCTSIQIGGTFSADRRHISNTTIVGEIPKFAGHAMLTRVASAWKLAGIYKASSGPWLTLSLAADRVLNGTAAGGQRPLQIRENPLCANPNASCWIDPAAFALQPIGTISPMRRSNIPGPFFWQFDLSLSRSFKIKESHAIEIRGEAFNLTNSFRAGVATGFQAGNSGINTAFGNAALFGKINSAMDPRVLQFAMKYTF